jgi:hypothetical protein
MSLPNSTLPDHTRTRLTFHGKAIRRNFEDFYISSELQTLVRKRTTEVRDTIGFNLAAIKIVSRLANEKKNERVIYEEKSMKDIWGELER